MAGDHCQPERLERQHRLVGLFPTAAQLTCHHERVVELFGRSNRLQRSAVRTAGHDHRYRAGRHQTQHVVRSVERPAAGPVICDGCRTIPLPSACPRRRARHPLHATRIAGLQLGLARLTTTTDFDPLSADFQRDPHATWARLRSTCPVARGGSTGDWWALTRYDDVVAAATDDRTFTSTRGVNIGEGIIGPPRFPMHYDPPQQTQFRRIMNGPFLVDNVERLSTTFRANTEIG